jgi:hypothetical protein
MARRQGEGEERRARLTNLGLKCKKSLLKKTLTMKLIRTEGSITVAIRAGYCRLTGDQGIHGDVLQRLVYPLIPRHREEVL